MFSSWGLAKLLDDSVREKTGKHLPKRVFERLSGEDEIAYHKRIYEEVIKPDPKPEHAAAEEPEAPRGIAVAGEIRRVERFVFAPGGEEVRCLTKDKSGFETPAAVLHVAERRWEQMPDARQGDKYCKLFDVAFSPDGKTVWMSAYEGNPGKPVLRQRITGSQKWKTFSAAMPTGYNQIEKFYPTPKGDELWLTDSGCGVLRVKLASGKVSQYVQSDFRECEGVEHGTLVEDYVQDLVFTPDGKTAFCAATGGGNSGITRIDLVSGVSQNFPVKNSSGIEKLVLATDNQAVWCIFNNSALWAFDIQSQRWTHKCSTRRKMPLEVFRSLVTSRDGQFVWIANEGGLGLYSLSREHWKAFVGQEWLNETASPPLCLVADGKTVLCGHDRGVALMAVDGSSCEVLLPESGAESCTVHQIVAIPKTDDFVCAISYPGVDALYRLDVQNRRLRKLKDLPAHPSTALAFAPDGHLWGALPGHIFCVDVTTGAEQGFPPVPWWPQKDGASARH